MTNRTEFVDRPLRLRSKKLRCRVYLPAHQPGLADGGMPGERYIDYHRQRARAGLGMQITGATPVLASEVWANGLTLMNVDDRIIPGYQRLADAVHEEGGLMLAQLAHVGAMETAGDHIVSASWITSELTQRTSRMATLDELAEIVELYRVCAARCRAGGLDGVEVSMAHGMLLASFISPAMNARVDGLGGDVEGRTRFPRQVLRAVREACGEDMIIGVRMPGDELIPDGIGPEDAGAIARIIAATGDADYLSITAGNNVQKLARVDHWPPTPAPFGAFRHLSRAVKAAVDLPVATVGRVTTIELAEAILRDGEADLVGMVRANIADPQILPKSRKGDSKEVRPCVGANVCINRLLDHKTLGCMVNPEIGRNLQRLETPVGNGTLAVVVGAGPAGLEAARRLAIRGFAVEIFERDAMAGGQMRKWSDTPSRREFFRALKWWDSELDRLDITRHFGEEARAEGLIRAKPGLVIVATGSTPMQCHIPGAGGDRQVSPYAALDLPGGDHILVRDEMGRLGAMLIAEQLKQRWKRVTLVTSLMFPGEGEGITTSYTLLRALAEAGVTIIDRAKPSRIEGRSVHLDGVFGEARGSVDGVDLVTSLTGSVSDSSLFAPLRKAGVPTYVIGDAKLPREVADAVEDAATTVWSLGSEAQRSRVA
ncbi:MAG: FAD-dependent oxidoreductase [Hyphomicrobiales bacterium]